MLPLVFESFGLTTVSCRVEFHASAMTSSSGRSAQNTRKRAAPQALFVGLTVSDEGRGRMAHAHLPPIVRVAHRHLVTMRAPPPLTASGTRS
jgi:hypothetical protein